MKKHGKKKSKADVKRNLPFNSISQAKLTSLSNFCYSCASVNVVCFGKQRIISRVPMRKFSLHQHTITKNNRDL